MNDSATVLFDEPKTIEEYRSINFVCGIIILVIGILGGFGNGVFLMSIKKFKVLFTPANLLLINLALGDFLMVISQNPYSGLSALMNRWLFGEIGCQVYGFMGFLSGTVMIGSMTVIAIYRYHVTKWSYENVNLTFKKTAVIVACVWIYAIFWSLMPLLGWARFGMEPSLTACTIDWRHNDASYKTFLVTYCVFGFVIPFAVQIICYYAASKILKRTDPRNNRNSIEEQKVKSAFVWTLHSSANKMGIALVSSFLVAWTPYAILCMWTVIKEPSTVPFFLTLIPPIFAKSFTFINPLVFYCSHPRLRRAMKLTITKCCQDYPLDLPVDVEDI